MIEHGAAFNYIADFFDGEITYTEIHLLLFAAQGYYLAVYGEWLLDDSPVAIDDDLNIVYSTWTDAGSPMSKVGDYRVKNSVKRTGWRGFMDWIRNSENETVLPDIDQDRREIMQLRNICTVNCLDDTEENIRHMRAVYLSPFVDSGTDGLSAHNIQKVFLELVGAL